MTEVQPLMASNRVNLLGVNVSIVDHVRAASYILTAVKQQVKQYVSVAPVSTLVHAKCHPDYCQVINQAGMVTPDGMPVVWLARLKGAKNIDRAYGPDVMGLVCHQGISMGIRHFLYGATEEVLAKLTEQLNLKYPGINICGVLAPVFEEQASQLTPSQAAIINQAGADVVWVALGSPKQDFWMALNRERLKAPVIIGVGAAFDFMAGVKPQAPHWMQRSGLEWLFRLCHEPRRLWRRYLIGNSLFIYFAIIELLKFKK